MPEARRGAACRGRRSAWQPDTASASPRSSPTLGGGGGAAAVPQRARAAHTSSSASAASLSRISSVMARFVRRSSFSSFLEMSRFRSQSILRGARLTTSCGCSGRGGVCQRGQLPRHECVRGWRRFHGTGSSPCRGAPQPAAADAGAVPAPPRSVLYARARRLRAAHSPPRADAALRGAGARAHGHGTRGGAARAVCLTTSSGFSTLASARWALTVSSTEVCSFASSTFSFSTSLVGA